MEKLLSVDDVAELLGLSRFTIYTWAEKRRLPALKVGSRLMFRPSDIHQWVDGRAQPEDLGPSVPNRAPLSPSGPLSRDLADHSQGEPDDEPRG